MESFSSEIWKNDLKSFKDYLESDASTIKDYASSVQYTYGGKLNIFSADTANGINQVYPSPVISMMESMMGSVDLGGMQIDTSMMSSMTKMMNSWQELIDNQALLEEQYEIVSGKWPDLLLFHLLLQQILLLFLKVVRSSHYVNYEYYELLL